MSSSEVVRPRPAPDGDPPWVQEGRDFFVIAMRAVAKDRSSAEEDGDEDDAPAAAARTDAVATPHLVVGLDYASPRHLAGLNYAVPRLARLDCTPLRRPAPPRLPLATLHLARLWTAPRCAALNTCRQQKFWPVELRLEATNEQANRPMSTLAHEFSVRAPHTTAPFMRTILISCIEVALATGVCNHARAQVTPHTRPGPGRAAPTPS